jgi:putative phosphoesterase
MARIGVLSDTHGLVRPEAIQALSGSDLIIHAGDIGQPEVIRALESIAEVRAVRGNVDTGAWAEPLPAFDVLELESRLIYVVHDRAAMGIDPTAAGFDVVISGHSHRPGVERAGAVLYVNPGSAGPRRFRLPIALARLDLCAQQVEAEIIPLETGGAQQP